MSATMTRRALRRARLGGRHAYRSAARHRAALAAVAAAAVLTIGTAAGGHEDRPSFGGPPPAHMQMHGPMQGGMPGWGDHR